MTVVEFLGKVLKDFKDFSRSAAGCVTTLIEQKYTNRKKIFSGSRRNIATGSFARRYANILTNTLRKAAARPKTKRRATPGHTTPTPSQTRRKLVAPLAKHPSFPL